MHSLFVRVSVNKSTHTEIHGSKPKSGPNAVVVGMPAVEEHCAVVEPVKEDDRPA